MARVVELLVGRRADVEAVTYQGFTPLYLAVGQGHAETTQLLLDAGAKPGRAVGADHVQNAGDVGSFPLFIAAISCDKASVTTPTKQDDRRRKRIVLRGLL